MAEFTLEDAPVYEALPDGIELLAEVIAVTVGESPFFKKSDPTQKEIQVSFRFRVIDEKDDGKYFGRTLFGNTPDTFSNHPECKLRIWVQELLRKDALPVGYRFDTDYLEGQLVKITVGNRTRKAADGSDITRDYVESVRRVAEESASDLF